jgi:hypothetical protein
MFGREPKLPIDDVLGIPVDDKATDGQLQALERARKQQEDWRLAKSLLEVRQTRMKTAQRTLKKRQLQVGDLVCYTRKQPLKVSPTATQKLASRVLGPYHTATPSISSR